VSNGVPREEVEAGAAEPKVPVAEAAVTGVPVGELPILEEEHLFSITSAYRHCTRSDLHATQSNNSIIEDRWIVNENRARTYCEPVHDATDEADVFEDFRDANAPPIAAATIATTTIAPTTNTIKNTFLDIPQYLRGGSRGKEAFRSSLGATALG